MKGQTLVCLVLSLRDIVSKLDPEDLDRKEASKEEREYLPAYGRNSRKKKALSSESLSQNKSSILSRIL